MTLAELRTQLERFGRGETDLAALHEWLAPILAADSLDIEESSDAPWEHAPDETRLFWRLVYLFEAGGEVERLRRDADRLLACLDSTGDAGLTYELLPLVLDQERFATIVTKHLGGTISRTGFLNVVTESGYPPHVKLWLERAHPEALRRLTDLVAAGSYGDAARALEHRP